MDKLLAKPLIKSDQESLISSKLSWILKAVQPQRIIVFGSAARFEMTTASDIDLALIFVDAETKEHARQVLYKARPVDDWPHDLLFYTAAEFKDSASKGGGAAFNAQLEGRVIFTKESVR